MLCMYYAKIVGRVWYIMPSLPARELCFKPWLVFRHSTYTTQHYNYKNRYYRIKTKSTLNFTENTLMLNIICTFLCTVFMTTWNNIVQMNTTLKERCPLGSPYTFLTQRTETTASSVITSMTTKSTIFLMFCILSTHFTDDTSSTTMKGK